MSSSRRRQRGLSLAAAVALVVPAGVVMLPAAAAPPDAPAAADLADVPEVTVTPDPSYQGPEFEGWGTSLVWFANATGGYPDEVREELADMVFGDEGLNLNIARYNIGGGNAPDVPDYLRPGGAVEGWWHAPEGTTRDDVDWWSPEDPEDWNDEADQTQRWWVDRIKDDVTHWETFSNSPPWFMTESGYVSGGFDSSADQLKPESIEDFVRYLVGVTERLEDDHGIEVDTLDPFNEPNTPYWGTQLGEDGNPTGGRQEGAHIGPELQQDVLTALSPVLEESTTDADISAMDETNPGIFVNNWLSYPQEVRDLVDQLNVHTYGTGQRTSARDLAKGEDKPLWMSEVGGSWGVGQNFVSMDPGLGIAGLIGDDLRELEPSAWVFWQPVEDFDNMAPGGESELGANWGSIQMPFDCTAQDTLETCPIYTNTKYDTVRNFTHYIEPGDHVIGADDTAATAAISPEDRTATVVYTNERDTAVDVTVDLSKFGRTDAAAEVTPIVSDVTAGLAEGDPVPVEEGTATLRVPARSVTTMVVDGVHGVAKDADLVQRHHVYRLEGVQSGLSATAEGDGAVIRTTDPSATDQLWSIEQLTRGQSNREEYAVRNVATGEQLVLRAGSAVLEPGRSRADTARWILSTTGDGTYTLVSATGPTLLEVGGQSVQDGAAITAYQPNSGANQRWEIVDETVIGISDVALFTVPGTAPDLPDTVVPTYPDGERGSLPVTWRAVPEHRWDRPGQVRLHGTATTATGQTLRATATVTVDELTSTTPATTRTYVGGQPSPPDTVTGVSELLGVEVDLPVTWDLEGAVFDEVGVVEVPGVATVVDGSTLPATLEVTVTEPVERNAALDDGVQTSATFTEPGYGTAGLVNGDLGDKAWSNWVPQNKRATGTLTVVLAAPRDVTSVTTRFYADGGTASWAQSLRVEALVDGTWTPISDDVLVDGPGPAPVVQVDTDDVRTDAVRVVLDARPNTHLTVSEIEVFAKAADDG